MGKTALIFCEGQFGLVDGKTAVGLVRQSEIYNIVGVIDSKLEGKDAGEVLGMGKRNIPIFKSLVSALQKIPLTPDYLIYGKAPVEACIPSDERFVIIQAMRKGMGIVNGLHQLFSEDTEFQEMAREQEVEIMDIRKPPDIKNLHIYSGKGSIVSVPVIAVLGTDCASGKRTTAVELNKELNNLGIRSILVGTGQTSLMQGSKYGIAIDAIPSQFVIGEIEDAIYQAFREADPDIILVEGQGAVGHEAFLSSIAIIRGSHANGIILQHAPFREKRCDFPFLNVPSIESEINLISALSKGKVIAIALNSENSSKEQMKKIKLQYEDEFNIFATDVLNDGCGKLIKTLTNKFELTYNKINKELVPYLEKN